MGLGAISACRGTELPIAQMDSQLLVVQRCLAAGMQASKQMQTACNAGA